MASVLVYDRDEDRLGQVAELIQGHIVTCVDNLPAAGDLALRDGIDLVLADWTDSGGQQIARQLREEFGLKPRALVILSRAPLDPDDPESKLRLLSAAMQVGAHGILYRPEGQRALLHRINTGITRTLFEGWLLGLTKDPRFPFDREVMVPTRFTRGFTEGPLAQFAELFGGWQGLRDAAPWSCLARDADGFSEALRRLGTWAFQFSQESGGFLSTLRPSAEPAVEARSALAQQVLDQLRRRLVVEQILPLN